MAKNVDENVVQMRFDNAQFEKGVKQSVKSIDNLKKSLDFKNISNSLSSIEKTASRFDLSGITSSLESVKNRFSTLGVIGASALNNLTTAAMNAGNKIFSALSTPLIEGGKTRALNIEQAKFQFEGLGMDVEKSMKSALDAVSGTAYGLDQAAKAASQFGASGMQAGAEMTKSLRGIAGVAAMTNSSYDEIANIFTQVAGQGRLMGDQLLQLSTRGINAASTLAKCMKKSEAEVREMVSKGQIDFKTFYTAMDEAFGEHAKDANKTFTGALSNVKAALSRIGADIATPAYENLRKVFVNLIPVIDGIHEALAPMVEFMSKGIVAARKLAVANLKAFNAKTFTTNMNAIMSIVKSFSELIEKISPIFDEIKKAWDAVFPPSSDQVLTQIADEFSRLVNELVITEDVLNDVGSGFTNVFQGFAGAIDSVASYIGPITDGLTSVFSGKFMSYALTATELFRDFWVNLKLSAENSDRLRNIVFNLSEILDMLFDAGFRVARVLVDLTSGSGELVSSILKGVEGFTSFARNVAASGEVGMVFSKMLGGLSTALSSIGNLIGFIGTALTALVSSISESFANLTKVFSDTAVETDSFANGIVRIVLAIIEVIPEAVGRAISAIGNAVSMILENVPVGEVNAAIRDTLFTLITANILNFTNQLKRPINDISGIFESFKDIGSNLSSVFENLGNSIGTFTNSIKATVLLKIAISLGILAVSLKLLSDIPLENLAASLAGLAGGLVIMGAASAGLLAVLKKMAGDLKGTIQLVVLTSQLRKMALSMVLFAAAIKILASAMKDLSSMSWEEIARGLVAISAMAGIMVGITKLSQSTKGMAKAAVMLIVFSGCIHVLTGALQTMGQLSWDELARGLFGFGASMIIVAAAMKVVSKAAQGKGIIGASVVLIAFSASMSIMGSALQKFNDVDTASILKAAAATTLMMVVLKKFAKSFGPKELLGAGMAMGILAAYSEVIGKFAEGIAQFEDIKIETVGKAMVTIAVILEYFSKFISRIENPWAFAAVAGSLWGITNAIKAFGEAVQQFADMPFEVLLKGMVAIAAGLAIMLTAMSKISGGGGQVEDWKKNLSQVFSAAAFDAFVFGISMFADAVAKIGSLPVETLAKGLVAISIGLTAMVVAMNSLKGGVGSGAAFVLMAFGISMMLGPIQTLGSMSLGELAKGLIAFATALAIINIAATVMGKNATNLLKMAGTLTAVGVSITIFGIGLTAILYPIMQIASLDSNQVASSVVGLAGIMSTLYAFALAMKNLPKFDAKTILKLAIMTIVIGAVGAIIAQLGSLNPGAALESAAALASVLLSVSAAMFVLSKVPVVGAAKGVATMAVIIGGLSAIVAAMGALAQIPGAKWLMEEGKQFMMSVGDAIGSFFGSIVGGVAGGAMNGIGNALPEFGRSLSEFMTAATPFFNGAQALAGGSLDGIKSFAEAILLITASELLTSATSWVTGGSSMVDFGKQLAEFAPYLMMFSMTVSSINASAIESAAQAAKSLANFANNLPRSGGLAGSILGESDMSDFGKKLAEFGPILKQYGESVKGIDASAIAESSEAAKGLSDFANALPRSGGLAGSILGETSSLAEFGRGLMMFAPSLVAYSTMVKGINAKAIKASAKAGMALTELANALPRSGGLIEFFVGSQVDFVEFGMQLSAFGTSMMLYGKSVEGIKPDAITASAKAGSALAELANELPRVGGVVDFFAGAQVDLAQFGTQIVAFGGAMMAYSMAVAGIDPEAVTASANAATSLSSLWETLPRVGGVVDFFAGSKDFSKFSSGITYLGAGIKSFSKNVAEVKPDQVRASAEAAKVLAELNNALPNTGGLMQFIAGAPDLTRFGTSCTYLGTGIKNFAKKVEDVKPESITGVANAAKAIVELSNAAPYTGGLQEFINGTQDIEGFKDNMGALGEGIAAFASNTSEVSAENIAAIANAADVIIKLADAAPYTDGLGQFINGTKDIGDFGESLGSLGAGLNTFIGAIVTEGFNAEAVTAVSGLVEVLAKLSEAAPTIGGLKSIWEGVKDFDFGSESSEDFGTKMAGLGTAVAAYCNSVGKLPSDSIESIKTSTEVLRALADMMSSVDKTGGVQGFFEGEQDYGAMKDNFENLAKALVAFVNGIGDTSFDSVSTAAEAINSIKDMINGLKDFDGSGVAKFKETLEGTEDLGLGGFKDNVSDAVEGVKSVLDDFTSKIDEAANSVNSSYGVLQEALSKEMPDNNNFVVSTIKKINENIPKAEPGGKSIGEKFANGVTSAVRDKYQDFYNAGKYTMEGVAAGIDAGKYLAISSASNAASAALTAFNNRLKIQSPSREFMKSGMFADMGAAKGMERYAYLVRNAGADLGEKAQDGFDSSMSKLGSAMDVNVDYNPTIRPVIDLSGVQIGAKAIDGMLGSKTVGINAAVSGKMSVAASALNLDRVSANAAANNELLKAVKGLESSLSNINSTTTIINGVTYDDGTSISNAVGGLTSALRIDGRS